MHIKFMNQEQDPIFKSINHRWISRKYNDENKIINSSELEGLENKMSKTVGQKTGSFKRRKR